jgi:hypothetical protein
MRILPLAIAAAAVALPTTSVSAQYWRGDRGDYREYQRDLRQAERECRRELRRADSRREYRRELRECRRELREARRDYRRDLRDNHYGYHQRGYSSHSQPRYYGSYGSRYQPDPRYYWDGYSWRYRY